MIPEVPATVPDSIAVSFPTAVAVVKKKPAVVPFVCEIVTVKVVAWPTAGLSGLAVKVTVGRSPPPWHPSQPLAAMPFLRAQTSEDKASDPIVISAAMPK